LEYNKSYNNNSILANTQAANFYGQINYKLSEKWLSQTNLSYASCQFEYPAVNIVTINDTLLERRIRYQYTNQLNTQIQQNFIGDFYIGGFRNRVVAGIDAQIGKFDFPNTKDFAYDSLNYINPGVKYAALNLDDVKQKLPGKTNVGSRSATYAVGAYISDVFNITSNLEVMASIRWDKYKNEGNYNYTTNITGGIFDQSAISPKFGIVYQPVKGVISLFANYMNGFQFVTGQDINGNSFKPQYANQSEAGVKAEAFSGKLSVTASVYDISVTNATRTDPTNSAYSIQDGTQKSKGIEVEVIANPVSGLNIVAGYSYNDSKLSQANKDVVGKRPAGSGAYNVANGWISYRIPAGKLKGWGIGAGANYSGDQYFLNNTTARFIIPEYTVLDATLFYDNKDFRIGVKADNLTSEKYWAQSTLAPQAPLRIAATLTVKFK
jgi:iron complex outermembrane receptor protein